MALPSAVPLFGQFPPAPQSSLAECTSTGIRQGSSWSHCSQLATWICLAASQNSRVGGMTLPTLGHSTFELWAHPEDQKLAN
eukprot:960696-Amphidinium_carterae.1